MSTKVTNPEINAFGDTFAFCSDGFARAIEADRAEKKAWRGIDSICTRIEVEISVRKNAHAKFANGDIEEGVWASLEALASWELVR